VRRFTLGVGQAIDLRGRTNAGDGKRSSAPRAWGNERFTQPEGPPILSLRL